jgi:FAD/FMN-containing dehydrogenase
MYYLQAMIHASPSDRAGPAAGWATIHVNDVHARLNPTDMAEVWRPRNTEETGAVLNWAARSGRRASVCGGRHAMGGQQFLASGVLIDTRAMSEIVHLDEERGVVRAQAGITWPELVRGLLTMQREPRWGIIQKQTGADRLTLGGALSANVHGRSLDRPPLVADVESFVVVSARGESIRCSRGENAGLFARVIGGYGLFGVITEVDLRLRERTKVRRRVEMTDAEAVAVRFDERIGEGFEYGDFQFEIDPCSAGFLRRGVFSCYEPVDDGTPLPASQRALGREDWLRGLSASLPGHRRADLLV